MSDLLPPSATPQERALSEAVARVGAIPVRVREMWNAETCPAELLPWLAWAMSVDSWDINWTDRQKRETVKASMAVHRKKGTIGAVREALAALGIQSEVREWFQTTPAGSPYTFSLYLETSNAAITADELNRIMGVIDASKNLRSHLDGIYTSVRSNPAVYKAAAVTFGHNITIGDPLTEVVVPAEPDYVQMIMDLLPFGYWKIDEPTGSVMVDSSGNGHDGVYNSGGDAYPGLPRGDGALDGTTGIQFVYPVAGGIPTPIPDDLQLGSGEYSIVAFLRWTTSGPPGSPSWGALVFVSESLSSPFPGPAVFANLNSAQSYEPGKLYYRESADAGYGVQCSTAGLNDDQYRHFVFQRRRVSTAPDVWKLQVYCNGGLSGEVTLPSVLALPSSRPIRFMGRESNHVVGSAGHVAIFKGKSLSASEVAALFAASGL